MDRRRFEADLLDRLDRIAVALERLAPVEARDPVVTALAAHFGRDPFTSGEAIAAAQAQAEAAEAEGLQLPGLPHVLRQAGIEGPHALGRYLGGADGVGRVGQDRAGVLWQVSVAKPRETANTILSLRRRV